MKIIFKRKMCYGKYQDGHSNCLKIYYHTMLNTGTAIFNVFSTLCSYNNLNDNFEILYRCFYVFKYHMLHVLMKGSKFNYKNRFFFFSLIYYRLKLFLTILTEIMIF